MKELPYFTHNTQLDEGNTGYIIYICPAIRIYIFTGKGFITEIPESGNKILEQFKRNFSEREEEHDTGFFRFWIGLD